MSAEPTVFFYIPRDPAVEELPVQISGYWSWRIAMAEKYRFLGTYDWTLQTYLKLKDRDHPCQLVRHMPGHGIVIAHRDFLEKNPDPGPDRLLVCLKSDRPPLEGPQIHVVQNPEDRVERVHHQLTPSIFINHWIQPGLIPRSEQRGELFEHAGYHGCDIEMDEAFKGESWIKRTREAGFRWITAYTSDRWSDFSDLDVLVAVRRCRARPWMFDHKPASKLYNAWACGVPAILGGESAYRAERESRLDYMEVNSADHALQALMYLRDHPELRRQMVENGLKRAVRMNNDAITDKWIDFLKQVAVPAYKRWTGSVGYRKQYHRMRWLKKRISPARRAYIKLTRILFSR